MRSANDRGYECLLVADATTAIDPDVTPRALSMVEMSGGIFGAIGYTGAVTAAGPGVAGLVPGIAGEVDLNAFQGSAGAFRAWVRR